MLQCVAVYCNVLQCVAVCCSVLQCAGRYEVEAVVVDILMCVLPCIVVYCSVLLCVAMCCRVLQCVAVCFSMPAVAKSGLLLFAY